MHRLAPACARTARSASHQLPQRLAALTLAALALVAFGPLPTYAAEAEKQTDKAANLSWTLPPGDWEFEEVGKRDRSEGIIFTAKSTDGRVAGIVMTGDDGGLATEDRAKEMGGQLGSYAGGGVSGTKTVAGVLVGHAGQCVVIAGQTAGGTNVQVRGYVVKHDKKFVHLILRLYDGVEKELADEINALRRGLVLISGQGKEDAADTFNELAPGGSAGGTKPGRGADDAWPEKGPARDGDKVVFTGLNMEWTLPKESPFGWRNPISDISQAYTKTEESVRFQPVIRWAGSIERKKAEFDPEDAPKRNAAQGLLVIRETPGQHNSANYIRSPDFEESVKQSFGFESLNAGKTRFQDSVPLGNVKGVMAVMEGQRPGGSTANAIFVEVMLRGLIYQFYTVVDGFERDRMKDFQPHLNAFLAGVRFPESQDFVKGPLVGPPGFLIFGGDRGTDQKVQKEYHRSGFSWSASPPGGYTKTKGYTFKKPVGLAWLGGDERQYQVQVEGRSPDGQAYVFFSIWGEATGRLQNEKKSPEEMVDTHAKDWISAGGEHALASKSNKPPYGKPGSWSGAKGLKYEFSTMIDDVPYTEEGYVVKEGQSTYWVRIQLGGKDAEKKLGKMLKDLRKSVKWD